ncbi:MAG: DUF945 family protein, partial [Gammaproteobacteria bacterium]|nr:DUF945 family protein [Gammaproteobacteria bacterium]
DAVITINIPAVSDKVNGQAYKFSGMNFDVEYFSDDNRFLGELGVHELQVNGSGMLELKDLILSFNQSISSDNAAGDFVVSFDILKFDFKKNLFDIRQFSSRLKNIKKSNIISASVGLKVSKINLFSEQISSLSMDIASSGFEYNILKKNFLSMLSDEKHRMYDFGYNDYHYDSFITDRLDFFTEHGGFSSNLSLKNEQSGSDVDESYFSGKSIEMNVSAGDVLLRKIYKLITMNYEKDTVNKPKLFVKSLLKMKYIKNINNKYKFSLRNKEGKFIINNLYVTYDDFLQSFSSAVFIK